MQCSISIDPETGKQDPSYGILMRGRGSVQNDLRCTCFPIDCLLQLWSTGGRWRKNKKRGGGGGGGLGGGVRGGLTDTGVDAHRQLHAQNDAVLLSSPEEEEREEEECYANI